MHASRNTRTGVAFVARLLFVLLLVVAPLNVDPVTAQEPVAYAGIVIHPGDGTVTYAYVPLDEPVSGIELLRRSGISLLTVGFGGLGEGVCKIEETGCDVGPCRKRVCQTSDPNSPFWHYFQQNDGGEWILSPLGGSATRIEPGEVDGWSWTPGEPRLPEVALSAIPSLAQATGGNLDEPHFARYNADGKLMSRNGSFVIPARQYAAVGIVLLGIALFAFYLRMRPRMSA